ncbi:MAG: hypothetical protein J6T35_03700 [Bacteroidales bacterium]|nr:hypothetical protein [Bacteroidales bacterium]
MKRTFRFAFAVLAVLFSISCLTDGTTAYAQTTAVNLYLGVAPGVTKLERTDKYSTVGAFADLEYATDGFCFLVEGSYTSLLYDDIAYDQAIGVDFYVGPTLFSGRRFQVPIMAGLGITSIGDYHKAFCSFDCMARAKFYVTNRLGLFAGVAGGVGKPGRTWGRVEAGLVFAIKLI